jgi:hypothetical protein
MQLRHLDEPLDDAGVEGREPKHDETRFTDAKDIPLQVGRDVGREPLCRGEFREGVPGQLPGEPGLTNL